MAIRRYNWPGNVTELKTVVESAAAQSADDLIGPDAFPLSFRVGRDAQRLGPRLNKIVPLEQTLEQVEREQIERALEATRRNISQAAELLGLTRAKLYRRMSALAIALDEREVEPPSPPVHS
ncbi:MAG: helix-turn-helix domain-containing protein [Planctomycetaceae bacterium]